MANISISVFSFLALVVVTHLTRHIIGEPVLKWVLKNNKSFSNKLYKQAAKLNTQFIMLVLFSLIFLIIFVFSEYFIIDIYSSEYPSEPTKSTDSPLISDEVISNWFVPIYIGIICLFNFWLYIIFVRHILIHEMIVDYCHNLKIIRPLISEEENIKIQQEWAMIESEEDYKMVKEKLEALVKKAKKEKTDLPLDN